MENDTDLNFLGSLKFMGKQTWSLEKAKEFLEALKQFPKGKTSKEVNEELAKRFKVSTNGANALRTELRKALEKGYKTLESYYDAGGPCRYGKEKMCYVLSFYTSYLPA